MSLLEILILALIQGITEFLPISSSGHLILLPSLMGAEDQGIALDVAVHVGTLFAVILYFWRDVVQMFVGAGHIVTGRFQTPAARLTWLLVLATIPVILFGLVLKVTGLADAMRSPAVIAWTMLIFGIVLYFADQRGAQVKTEGQWSVKDAIVMGLWQALALIPGTSRSGATITGARMLGYDRRDGAKLAMLMSIPTIIASGALLGLDLAETGTTAQFIDIGLAILMAFGSALLALILMMRLLATVSFTPYVIYRVVLGIGLLIWVYA